jgi:hypothetical protein
LIHKISSFVLEALILTSAFSPIAGKGQITAATRVPNSATDRRRLPADSLPMVNDYKITILSDMIMGRRTIGEWGFSALIEIASGGVDDRVSAPLCRSI